MSDRPAREPHDQSHQRTLRGLDRLITIGTWCLCATFVWAGARAWLSGAGIAMMLIAIGVCVVCALALPHLRSALHRSLLPGFGTDDEWPRFHHR